MRMVLGQVTPLTFINGLELFYKKSLVGLEKPVSTVKDVE